MDAADEAFDAPKRLCVVLHDVAPANWVLCRQVLTDLCAQAQHAQARLRVTMLVVPRWHGRAATPDDYLAWLHQLQRAGHELALHGLTHHDDAPRGSLWQRFARDVLFSAGEGEFAALTHEEAARRLRIGRAWAKVHGLDTTGFVAPAWLMNRAGRQALRQAGFDYTCTPTRLLTLPDEHAVAMRGVGFSPRARWRRGVSVAWARALAGVSGEHALLRLDLHPCDSTHVDVRRAWFELLRRELPRRQCLLLRDAAKLALPTPGPAAGAPA